MKLKLKLSLSLGAALVTLLFSFSSAFAQCSRVIQNGTVSNNAAVVWVAPCVLGQAGPSSGSGGVGALPMINDLGIQGSLGILDNPITGPYHQGLFDWSNSIAGEFDLNLGSFGGAAAPTMAVIINGTKYPFPGAGNGNVIAPVSPFPTAGDLAQWNGGTNLIDSGIKYSDIASHVATIAALKALPLTGLSAGFMIGVNSYQTPGDMPPDVYRLVNSVCNNTGLGDGGSQIPSNTSGWCWNLVPEPLLSPANWGVVYGGTDPNGNNGTLLTAAATYAAVIGSAVVDLGGNTVALTPGNAVTVAGGAVLQDGTVISLASGGSGWVPGQGSRIAHTFWLNTAPVTTNVWVPTLPWSGAYPVGMVNVSGSGSGLNNLTIDCNNVVNCTGLVEGSTSTNIKNITIQNYDVYGHFFGGGSVHEDESIHQGGSGGTDATKWTGYGMFCERSLTGSAADNIENDVIIHGTYIGFANDCGDTKFGNSHIFPAPVGPSDWIAVLENQYTSNSNLALVNDTFDNSRIVIQLPSGVSHIPQVQIKGDIWEFGSGGTVDANVVLQCMGSSQCGETTSSLSNILLDGPLPTNDNGNSLTAYGPVALEDQNGNLNPDAFTDQVQIRWGTGFNCTLYCGNVPFQNTTAQGAQFTFTGNAVNGQFNITSASILPTQGTAISDSGGLNCIAPGAQITDISYTVSKVWFTGATTNPCSGSDTVTVGGLTLTGTINAATNTMNVTGGLPNFALYEHIDDSASANCVSGWISGYNEHTGQVIWNKDTGVPATCGATNDTFTVTPSTYYPAPSDSGSLLLGNSSGTTTLELRSDMPRAWFVDISPRNGPGSVTLAPLSGGAMINNGASAVTLIDGTYAVDRLFAASQQPANYAINNGYFAISQGPKSLSGGGTGIAFSPTNPQSTLAFGVDVGTSAGNTFTAHFFTAYPGWSCTGSNTTTPADTISASPSSTNATVIRNYLAGVLTNFNDHDIVKLQCAPG